MHSRIGSLTGLRLPRFADHLKRLCLRQNFISVLDPEVIHPLTKLEELDLYDNKVKHLGDALDKLSNLSYVSELLEFADEVILLIGIYIGRSTFHLIYSGLCRKDCGS